MQILHDNLNLPKSIVLTTRKTTIVATQRETRSCDKSTRWSDLKNCTKCEQIATVYFRVQDFWLIWESKQKMRLDLTASQIISFSFILFSSPFSELHICNCLVFVESWQRLCKWSSIISIPGNSSLPHRPSVPVFVPSMNWRLGAGMFFFFLLAMVQGCAGRVQR